MYLPDLGAEPKRCRKMGSSGECFILQVVGELHGCLVAWPWPQCWVLPSPMCIFGEQPSPSAGEGECHGMSAWLSDWVTQWNNPLWLHQETWSPDLWRILCSVKIESSLQDQLSLRCKPQQNTPWLEPGDGSTLCNSGRRIGLVSCFYENHNSFEPSGHWL